MEGFNFRLKQAASGRPDLAARNAGLAGWFYGSDILDVAAECRVFAAYPHSCGDRISAESLYWDARRAYRTEAAAHAAEEAD